MSGVKVIEDAGGPVLSIETLRQQCEVVPYEDATDSDALPTHPDDDLLLGYLSAAVDMAEHFTGRSIALRTYEAALSEFPSLPASCAWNWPSRRSSPIDIPLPPLVEVISFTNGEDSDGPVDSDAYVLDDFGAVAQLVPVGSWPAAASAVNAVRIRYRAGYSSEDSDAKPLPAGIRQALLLTVADWYNNRENTTDTVQTELPQGAMLLLRQYRVRLGMA